MFQLITTISALALTAALFAVGVRYVPWWFASAEQVTKKVEEAFGAAAKGYEVVMRASGGTAPQVVNSPDGGFSDGFSAAFEELPAPPGGFAWRYGLNMVPHAPWAGMNWICLDYVANEGMANKAVWIGANNAKRSVLGGQIYIATECGAHVDLEMPSQYPAKLAVTMYLAYSQEIAR